MLGISNSTLILSHSSILVPKFIDSTPKYIIKMFLLYYKFNATSIVIITMSYGFLVGIT